LRRTGPSDRAEARRLLGEADVVGREPRRGVPVRLDRGPAGPGAGRLLRRRSRRGQPAAGKAASPGTADPGTAAPGPLGPREADVARLVADGLTNKQIGTRLFISERTVDSHVRSILNKLGFSSRAQITAWMVTDPLAAVPQKRQRH
jgi:DNA-binding CsgD family transcriptional regulator